MSRPNVPSGALSGIVQKQIQDKIDAAKNDPEKREAVLRVIEEANKEYDQRLAEARAAGRPPMAGSGRIGHVHGKLLAAGLIANG